MIVRNEIIILTINLYIDDKFSSTILHIYIGSFCVNSDYQIKNRTSSRPFIYSKIQIVLR